MPRRTHPTEHTTTVNWQASAITGLNDLWSGLLDLVYPPKCLVCGDMQSKYLCAECLSEIVFINPPPPICSRCGAPNQENGCGECRGVEFAFDSARGVGIYDGALKEAIHQLKYSGHEVIAPVLGMLIVDHLKSRSIFISQIDCIVPMPIHASRLRQRGFNQSELLAREIGRAFELPILPRTLIRGRATRPQVELSVEERLPNVDGAFEVVRSDAVSGRRVLLVDDVFTTGSTSDSASRALRDAGAGEVHVLTLARSV